MTPFFTLIRGGEVHAPEPRGVNDVLLVGRRVARIGDVDREALKALDLGVQEVDARGCLVVPGFVDPHQHLIGAGGEQGFASRQPEVTAEEVLQAGVTTVVGVIGTDTTTRHLTSLLAKVRELRAAGVNAFMYTGGFPVPPPTITGSVTDDLVLFDEILGVGEIAISDTRSYEPTTPELARLVSASMVGARVGGKTGPVHFHVGDGRERLKPLFELLEKHEVPPRFVYPTHVTRSEDLFDEAIRLAERGCYVDVTADDGEEQWLRKWLDRGAPVDRLTVSSDAQTLECRCWKLHACFVAAVKEKVVPLETALRWFSTNAAAALGLAEKGSLQMDKRGDVAVLDPDTLRVVHVVANGRWLVRDGQMASP